MTNAEPRTDLSRLVRERRAELRLSLRELADLCIDPDAPDEGPKWNFQVIRRLEKELPIIPPQAPELRALMAGLQLPLHEVQAAAGSQFMGIDTIWHSDRARLLLRNYEAVSEEDRKRAEMMLAAWAEERSAKPDAG
ncbi:XRE family transcriptional regulator [Streptomyces sp. NPDC093109]|uniref:XRE family transcriptional regulator n=1 Tax=Streptomyces sp. NPDC093109 TaxID=3154977 RepID=UPI00345033F1